MSAESRDDPLNAFVTEVRRDGAEQGPLAGRTVAVKDNISTDGIRTTCASRMLAEYVPPFDATVVERLQDAGATIVGKTNMDEFGMGTTTETSAFGPTLNPVDPDHVAGGSSGGSAAAVAAGQADLALGSDTGGSIRCPAAFCGVVGLKPTYGLVPLHGVVENTYTQDHVGPLANSVREAARVLEVLAGADDRDPASLQAAGRVGYRFGGYVEAVDDRPSVADLTLGVLESGLGDGVTARVVDRTEAAVERLKAAGATVTRLDVAGFEHGRAIKNALSVTELAAHWRDGGAPYRRGGVVDPEHQAALADRFAAADELGPFYRAKLLAGAAVIDAAHGGPYTRAQAAREVLRERFDAALADVDALVLPTTPDVAPRIEDADEPPFDYARNTRAADVTRLPALSLPNDTLDGLPVGLQLVGGAFGEATLLGAAAAVEATLAA
jgi:Asp-tRNA(Asn)/Glu-tRNA(Gln) amidotransferase A subunit family amidase